MKIKNFDELNKTEKRGIALKIAERGLEAIDTKLSIRESVKMSGKNLVVNDKKFPIDPEKKIILIGIGKCSLDAVSELTTVLGDNISKGVVLDVRTDPTCDYKNILCLAGTHPLPSEDNVIATMKIIGMISGLTKDDTVLFVISGGGSTLLCQPKEGLTPESEKNIFTELMKAGAPIKELNTIRKHLSMARGGFLAKHAFPARVISLIFSDVSGNDTGFIASGPTTKDETSVKDAIEILSRYKILEKLIIKEADLIETPKEDKYFKNVSNILLVSNEKALNAMAEEAAKFKLRTLICSTDISGEAQKVGASIMKDISSAPTQTALLYGGETTVTIQGSGVGGRNQELALATIEHLGNEIILAIASDGHDNGQYAGAIADLLTKQKSQVNRLDPKEFLKNNDATSFFEATGDLIETGDTGSNVSDLIIAIK